MLNSTPLTLSLNLVNKQDYLANLDMNKENLIVIGIPRG
jgi:hypothetical protein